MPKTLTALHVFIASPGGLRSERLAFKEVIDRVNADHAHEAGITFVPRGWEFASAGVGRPQEIINEQVRESDYMVVLLWDKWGRPPGGSSDYTSGTEEEYMVALECLREPERPMRDIVVLFKGVQERQMADPGQELAKVLAFKDSLEGSRILLYSTFDTLEEFKDDFRAHLHTWIRDWQGQEPPAKTQAPDANKNAAVEPHLSSLVEVSDEDIVVRAKAAADRGRLTVAEQLFAKATTGVYDRNAFTEYVRFLRKSGRLSLAQATAQHFLELAQDADDHVGEVEACANLAILERQQGRNESSLVFLARAREANDEYLSQLGSSERSAIESSLSTKAFLLDNEALTLRRLPGREIEALAKLDEARRVQELAGDERGSGFTWRNKGSLFLRMGRLVEAEEAFRAALGIFEKVGYLNGQAATLGSLGELYEAMEEYPVAVDMLDKSLTVSPHRIPSRNAMNYSLLSRVHLKNGDLQQAKDFANACSRFAQELGTVESQATALHCQSAIAMHEGSYEVARVALEETKELFDAVENPVGLAAVELDLAKLHLLEKRYPEALASAETARATLSKSPHFTLQRDLERLVAALEAVDNA
jgi:tetratricopeptide (TPR) repeat protein